MHFSQTIFLLLSTGGIHASPLRIRDDGPINALVVPGAVTDKRSDGGGPINALVVPDASIGKRDDEGPINALVVVPTPGEAN
ncbi:hypothetical protein AAE478_008830 [Parahypoxylon ruwenzoriense]